MKQEIDITWSTILKFFFILILLYFIFLLKDILIWTALALVLSILLIP